MIKIMLGLLTTALLLNSLGCAQQAEKVAYTPIKVETIIEKPCEATMPETPKFELEDPTLKTKDREARGTAALKEIQTHREYEKTLITELKRCMKK
jgi:hypothetical protein